MVNLGKAWKGAQILSRPRFARPLMRHGVAAAVEHLAAIRHTAAGSLIDVGANKGQFSLAFRGMRPNAQIIAFEPLLNAAATYARIFRGDPLAELFKVALSAREDVAEFYVTDRPDSSSLLKPTKAQEQAFNVQEKTTIKVQTKPLSACINLQNLPRPRLLKIDVQGGELQVLKGADKLEDIDFIYVELSFVELYEGQPLFEEVNSFLKNRQFSLTGVFNQTLTDEFGPTQADFLFSRDIER